MQVQEDFESRKRRQQSGQSRHFWELKAEQVLNKVFDQQQAKPASTNGTEFTDVEILYFRPNETHEGKNNPQEKKAPTPTGKQLWQTFAITSAAALSLVFIHLANEHERSLVQAHNLRLLEQLREDGQRGGEQRHQANETVNGNRALRSSDPPSPPSEEWMEELAKLPPSNTKASDLLKVPLHGTLKTIQQSRPSAQPSIGTAGGNRSHLPQLLGIIQGTGTLGSAIIQWDGTSASVNVGEAIGTSGWVLRSSTTESAIIERSGLQRRISINIGG